VRYRDQSELLAALRAVPGSLTATLHSEAGDDVAQELDVLQGKAGRVLFAGWPTGVAVTWSQQHGGPWPATTSLHTSVGVTAIRRFLRPIAFQDAPAHLLPPQLRDEALVELPHRRNGVLQVP
jgi:NADP-dependent aldehyde dehydrogenase